MAIKTKNKTPKKQNQQIASSKNKPKNHITHQFLEDIIRNISRVIANRKCRGVAENYWCF